MPPYTSLEELNGKLVAMLIGIPAAPLFGNLKPEIIFVQNEVLKVKMLVRGRVDAIVGWYPDTYTVFRSLGVEPTAHDRKLVLYNLDASLVCHSTPTTIALLRGVNSIMAQLKREEEFRGIFRRHGVPFSD